MATSTAQKYEEKKELQKLLKARDLPEYTTFAEKPEEEEIEDTSNRTQDKNSKNGPN